MQCCKVLGRKSALEKRKTALHELPGPGKPKRDMQKDNCIAVLQVLGRKIGQCTELLPAVSASKTRETPSRTCKKNNFIALLHGPG
jgi:hypothetical protein